MQIRLTLLLSLMFASQLTIAADAPQSALQTQSARTRPASSQADDLQKIVVLCATKTDSDELKQAWADYVVKYHEADAKLDLAVDNVLARASAYRQSDHSSTGRLTWTAAERKQAHQIMYDTAKAALQNAR